MLTGGFVAHAGTRVLVGTLHGGGRGLPGPHAGPAVNLRPGLSRASSAVIGSWKQCRAGGLRKDLVGAARPGPGMLLSFTIIPGPGLNIPWPQQQWAAPGTGSAFPHLLLGGGRMLRAGLSEGRQLRALCGGQVQSLPPPRGHCGAPTLP